MLVTFQCKGYANITMFGDIAIQLLQIMNHSATIPGALSIDDVPHALAALQNAVNQMQPSISSDKNPAVSLRQRALPLLGLLEYASLEKYRVMWSSN